MYVIDGQVHVWAADTPARPWRPLGATFVHRPVPFGPEDLLRDMDEAGVNRAVLVPPSWEGDRNDLALEAAANHPDRFAVMGRLPIESPESRDALASWKDQPGMLGIRMIFSRGAHRDWLSDGTADWFWPAAEAADLPVMVYAPGLTARLVEIAGRHPRLRLIVDHLGIPVGATQGAVDSAVDDVSRLARYPNVAVKASALPCSVSEPFPFPSLHEPIRRLVRTFGAQRVFWGTDLTRLPCTYRQAVDLFAVAIEGLSDTDREWIMGRGIAKWLDWPAPDAPWSRAGGAAGRQ